MTSEPEEDFERLQADAGEDEEAESAEQRKPAARPALQRRPGTGSPSRSATSTWRATSTPIVLDQIGLDCVREEYQIDENSRAKTG